MDSRSRVNHTPLTPISFLERAASVHPHALSIIYGEQKATWQLTLLRCKRLATALRAKGIETGETVAVIAPNIPEMVEAHFGLPMSGAVMSTINTRLDGPIVAHILRHGRAKFLIVHQDFLHLVQSALDIMSTDPHEDFLLELLIVIKEQTPIGVSQTSLNASLHKLQRSTSRFQMQIVEYEELLLLGDPNVPFDSFLPASEDQPIALNYTSGTTSAPKGVVYTHRGAFLNALSVILMSSLQQGAVYLWTVPMFHCNGWCFPWGVAALSGTNVCLKQIDVTEVFRCIATHGVDILCGAPTVLTMLITADSSTKGILTCQDGKEKKVVKVITGGAPPPAAVIGQMEEMGFKVLHTYGLTETYGPATICEWKEEEWSGLDLQRKSKVTSRQGVRHLGLDRVAVIDPETMKEVPWDGTTMGEVMLRGNTVMKGYLHDEESTEKAFAGGWFHSGDLGVMHEDGYIQLKDRSKDIIISGGENISTIFVEGVLYQHPRVLEAAVVGMPDEKWGETPIAFVTLKDIQSLEGGEFLSMPDVEADIKEFCRLNMPKFMAPTRVLFGQLPKTSTGKTQKFKLRDVAKSFVAGNGTGSAKSIISRL